MRVKRLVASLILMGTLLVPSSAFAGPDPILGHADKISLSLDINVANSLGETGVVSFFVYEHEGLGHLRIRLCQQACEDFDKVLSQTSGDLYSLSVGYTGRVDTYVEGLGNVYLFMPGMAGPVNVWGQVGPRTETSIGLVSDDPHGTIVGGGALQFASRFGDWGPIAGMDGLAQALDVSYTGVF